MKNKKRLNKKTLNLLLVFCALTIGTLSHADSISRYMDLPKYLNDKYAKATVEIKTCDKPSVVFYPHKKKVIGPRSKSKSYVKNAMFRLCFDQKLSPQKNAFSWALGFLPAVAKSDDKVANALSDLENIHTLNYDSQTNFSANLLERVKLAFARKVTGSKEFTKDKVASTWYKLKFESTDPFTEVTPIKRGEPVLLIMRQFGYFEKSGNIITDLRRRLDFGHSALGIRYFGMGPDKDLLINPGSKNLRGYEVTLPNKADPNVPNLVDIDNLWVWTETQLYKRYMQIELKFIPLTKEQKKAMAVLVPALNGFNLGPAVAMTNNCAHGAAALVNFILPIQHTFDANSVLGPALPKYVLTRPSKRFSGSGEFEFPNIVDQNPYDQTPGVSYKEQTFRSYESFEDYLTFEAQYH